MASRCGARDGIIRPTITMARCTHIQFIGDTRITPTVQQHGTTRQPDFTAGGQSPMAPMEATAGRPHTIPRPERTFAAGPHMDPTRQVWPPRFTTQGPAPGAADID